MNENLMPDLIALLHALLLGIVEGATEFLPVSSTGHLILTGSLLGFESAASKAFFISIQIGAVLAVVWLYRARFVVFLRPASPASIRLGTLLLAAFMPAAILGLLFADFIEELLFHPVSVAVALVVGGLIMLLAERLQKDTPPRIQTMDDMSWTDALKIGLAQSVALIPGTSRSGATIVGGMFMGFSRVSATEFSFFLSVPTLFAAGGYSLLKHADALRWEDLSIFLTGAAAAFFSALVVVGWLVKYVSSHSLAGFAYYRIAFGLLVLGTWWGGVMDWTPVD